MFYPKHKIIFDCDLNFPSDDFQAFLLIFATFRQDIVSISATGGNTWVEEVWCNLRATIDLIYKFETSILSSITPTYISSRRSWALNLYGRGVIPFTGAYGKGTKPRYNLPQDQKVDDLASFINRYSNGKFNIIATGPLTNISQVIKEAPGAISKINHIFIMGGNFNNESKLDRSDFNMWFDPSAAQEVFNSNVSITLLPLNICRTVRSSTSLLAKLELLSDNAADIFYNDFKLLTLQHGVEMPLCDQLLALIYVDPSIIVNTEIGNVFVHIDDDDLCGHTTFKKNPTGNVQLITSINPSKALSLLITVVDKLNYIAVDKRSARWLDRI